MPGHDRGAYSGDRVRARTADRDASEVVGILRLRHIAGLDYVQVYVILDGGSVAVDPASVEVLEASVVPVRTLERGDPMVRHVGWRRISSLADAIEEGLVHPVERDGLTWEDLRTRMMRSAQPLIDVGWTLIDEQRAYGRDECVFGALKRGADYLVIEHYPDGWTRYWPADENFDSPEDLEPMDVPPDLAADELRDEYRRLGLL